MDEISDRKTFRRICFTYQLETDEIFAMPQWDRIKRYVFQKEKAPTTGQEHIQGYVEFENPVNWSTLKHKMPTGCHMEACKGSAKQNYEYCTKNDTQIEKPVFHGNWDSLTGQGRRSDLADVGEKVKSKVAMKEIAEEHPATFCRYHKGIKALQDILDDRSRFVKWEEMDCRWYYGPPGLGKTEKIYSEFEKEEVYCKNPNNKWWDGYDKNVHKVILIDDYRPNKEFPYDELLRLCQCYEFRAELKGSTVQVLATTVIITSNEAPWVYWPMVERTMEEENRTPMLRRFWYWNFEQAGIEKKLHPSCVNKIARK